MRWFNLLAANVRKEYIELKRYLPNTLSMILTFYAIFLAMFFGIKLVGSPDSMNTNIQYVIVNYIFWYLAMQVMNFIGWEITNEAMRGTLEQLYMSPMGAWRILLNRLAGSLLINLSIIIALLFISMLTAGQWLNLNPITLLPILLVTLVSMFGTSFIVAGLSIIFKQVNAFLQILQFILMGLTFIPLTVAPYLAFAPFVKGIDLMRNVMIYHMSLTDFGLMDYAVLIGNAIAYFVVGSLIFLKCEKIAMNKGLLGHY